MINPSGRAIDFLLEESRLIKWPGIFLLPGDLWPVWIDSQSPRICKWQWRLFEQWNKCRERILNNTSHKQKIESDPSKLGS